MRSSAPLNSTARCPRSSLTPAGSCEGRALQSSHGNRNPHPGRGAAFIANIQLFAANIELFAQTLLAAMLLPVFSARQKSFYLTNQIEPIDQVSSAGLKPAEAVKQLDGPPPAHSEQAFEQRAIDHRSRHAAQGLQDLGKFKKPRALGGHGARRTFSLC